MPSLSETLTRLAATQQPMGFSSGTLTDRLHDLTDFGADPGNLRARSYIPADLPRGAPLVVVLHGCTQSAAGYDHGSGWSTLADRHGFALLYPEQRPSNNANRCFNWFAAEHIVRDSGEVASIRSMIAHLTDAHALDPARVFVTGLSAGGAMTMALLATYPEIFAGGAVIAGLPYGTARSVGDALQRMRGIGLPSSAAMAGLLREAAPTPRRWPTLSVWHGGADHTVVPTNMEAIIKAWATLRNISLDSVRTDQVDGEHRRRWSGAGGRVAIEAYRIEGLGHGTPIDPTGPDGCGAAMPFMLPAAINSTQRIASGWGIAKATTARTEPLAAILPPLRKAARAVAHTGVAKTIEDALRAAGLMR